MTVVTNSIYNTRILLFTDQENGLLFAFLGLIVAIFTILVSSYPARYGIKISMIMLSILGIGYNLLMIMNLNRYIQQCFLYFLFVPCIGLSFISTKLGIKLYTYSKNRSIAYSIFFMILYICTGLSAGISDFVLERNGTNFQAFEIIFIINLSIYTVLLITSFFIRNLDVEKTGEMIVPIDYSQTGWGYIKEVLKTKKF